MPKNNMASPPIPYSRQFIDDEDIAAVTQVLKSDLLTQGPLVGQFEETVARYCGSQYAVSFSNGTTALHAACLALGLKEGDQGIAPPITFAATTNSLLYVKATPVFADVTQGLPLLNPQEFRKQINSKTKVVMPVHFAGSVCDMETIYEIAQKHSLGIIEDACHALGATYTDKSGKQHKVGNCAFGDMTIFSFHPVKSIATGEGGMVTTNSKSLYNHLVILRQHGVWKPDPATSSHPGWYYEMRELGYNYRLTEFQAALGISQMQKLDFFIKERKTKFLAYQEQLKGIKGIELLTPPSYCDSAFHLAVIHLESSIKRNGLYQFLKENGIGSQVHYIPVYDHPYYRDTLKIKAECPQTKRYFEACLSLPLYPGLSSNNLNRVVDTVKKWSQANA
ncbi:UDP-4-amino-4,6-dideoxy-N-acetyl-beta-L-altrosamine transaminase [bacterium]|nr:UDP-4-amino-4,6-dideoxy-N-acetyl-beta-L-altrosamine transaminase [bacterium]